MTDPKLRRLERETKGAPEAHARYKATLARTLAWRQCEDCRLNVPEGAWVRHMYEHDYTQLLEDKHEELERQQEEQRERARARSRERERDRAERATRPSGGLRIVPLPNPGPVGARPRTEALYWRLEVQEGERDVPFFYFNSQRRGWGDVQTNMDPPGGHLPMTTHFYLYGLSLVPDEGADPGFLQQIWNTSELEFRIGGSARADTILSTHPGRLTLNSRYWLAHEVMADPEAAGERPPERMVSIKGLPVELIPLMTFGFLLRIPDGACTKGGLLLALHGIHLRGLMG